MIEESIRDVLRNSILETTKITWKKSTVSIKTRSGSESVQGYVRQKFAVHKLKGTKGWTLTHVPSGMAMAKEIVTREAGQKIGDELASKFPDLFKADEKQVMKVAKTKGPEIGRTLNNLLRDYNKRKPTAKQKEKAEKDAAEVKAAEKFFAKLKTGIHDKTLNQLFTTGERKGLSVNTPVGSSWHSYPKDKNAEKIQEAFYYAVRAASDAKRWLDRGKTGDAFPEVKKAYQDAVKELKKNLDKLKKLGVDVSKTQQVQSKYLVRYKGSGAIYYGGKMDSEGSRKLGDEGPYKDGIHVMASNEKEAKDIASDKVNIRAVYLKAEKLR